MDYELVIQNMLLEPFRQFCKPATGEFAVVCPIDLEIIGLTRIAEQVACDKGDKVSNALLPINDFADEPASEDRRVRLEEE